MMAPDVVVGAGLAAAAAGTWAGFHLGVRLALVHSAPEETESDDLAVARAVGVYVPADGGRSSGRMAADILRHADLTDHIACDGGCGLTLCCCYPLHGPRCDGTVEQVCGHLNPLCAECAVRECDPCLSEATDHWFGGAR